MGTGLIRVPLTELRTNDEQSVGSEHTVGNKTYRWVKNISDTAVVAGGCCLLPGSSNADTIGKLIVSQDAASAKSAVVSMAGGVPMAAIIASGGAGSNCFGWVQVGGPKRINIIFSTTALIPGTLAIPSTAASGIGASAAWESLGAATALRAGAKCVVVLEKAAARSSGYGVASAVCDIRCL